MSKNKIENKPEQKKMRFQDIRRAAALELRGAVLVWKVSKKYMVLSVLENLSWMCFPYWDMFFMARLLDEVMTDRDPSRLFGLAAVLLLGNLVLAFFRILLPALRQEEQFVFDLEEQLLIARKIAQLDYVMVESDEIHNLCQRIRRETQNDRKNLNQIREDIPGLIGAFITIFMGIGLVWDSIVRVAAGNRSAWLLLLLPVGIWVSAGCAVKIEALYLACQDKISEACLHRDRYMDYLENYENGKETRIYGLGHLMLSRMMKAHDFTAVGLEEDARKSLPYNTAMNLSETVSDVLLRCIFACAAVAGRISVGSVIQCRDSVNNMMCACQEVGFILSSMYGNSKYLERYFSFLDLKGEMKTGCIPVEKRMDGAYRIEFEHVSFRYPGSSSYALKDINLKFEIGEKLAVVGMNGSGKTTFIKLLCRLYDPTEGRILMNGIDIRRYEYEEYLRLFSVVFQDFKLFSFTLGENVAVAEEYGEKEAVQALEKAGLTEFLEKQPKGLSTVLYREFDPKGLEISGGEAQKIALARAVCKGAPFVLLDEPTAALDPLAEYEIYKRFNDLVADRTTVYISHRMSSCRFCGDIAVFHEGRLIQRGSHEELIEQKDGKYYELWNAQAQYYTHAG